MEEVNEQQLPSYLRQLKKEGYSLVGLEQTVTSKILGQVQLPKKMALVLGHEKEGIPIDIIQVDFDFDCVRNRCWICVWKFLNMVLFVR